MPRNKICFVAPNAYPLLQGESSHKFMGGAELQQVFLGQFLQNKGYDVSFVTLRWNDDKSDEFLNGLRIFKSFSRKEGFPYCRFFYPRLFRTWRAMKRADADIYFQRGSTSLTGIVALYCVVNNKKFIFSGAHDRNFKPSIVSSRFFDKVLYEWGIKRASHIVVQSEYQKQILFENYGISGTTLKNIYMPKEITKDKKYILWVSNIKKIKRPLLMIEIAKHFPGYRFIMIGGHVKGEEELFRSVICEAKKLKNLEFLGFKPLDQTESYFDSASLFINTAEMEGFPNTFLQAWSRGIATISFLDIDNIITENKLGIVVESIDQIKVNIDKLMNMSIEDRQRISSYSVDAHSPSKYVELFESIIKNLYTEKAVSFGMGKQ